MVYWEPHKKPWLHYSHALTRVVQIFRVLWFNFCPPDILNISSHPCQVAMMPFGLMELVAPDT